MARTTDKLKNFEANYEKLEEVVKALDSPDLTLKESLDLYEKGHQAFQSLRKRGWNMPNSGPGSGRYSRTAEEDDSSDQTLEEGTLGL